MNQKKYTLRPKKVKTKKNLLAQEYQLITVNKINQKEFSVLLHFEKTRRYYNSCIINFFEPLLLLWDI